MNDRTLVEYGIATYVTREWGMKIYSDGTYQETRPFKPGTLTPNSVRTAKYGAQHFGIKHLLSGVKVKRWPVRHD